MTVHRFEVRGFGPPKLIEAVGVHTALARATERMDLKSGQSVTLEVVNLGPVAREKPLFAVGDRVESLDHTGKKLEGEVVGLKRWHGRLWYVVRWQGGAGVTRASLPADRLTRMS